MKNIIKYITLVLVLLIPFFGVAQGQEARITELNLKSLQDGPYKMNRRSLRVYVMRRCTGGFLDPKRTAYEIQQIKKSKLFVVLDGSAASACVPFLEALERTNPKMVCVTKRARLDIHSFSTADNSGRLPWYKFDGSPARPTKQNIQLTIRSHKNPAIRRWIKANKNRLAYLGYIHPPHKLLVKVFGKCAPKWRRLEWVTLKMIEGS